MNKKVKFSFFAGNTLLLILCLSIILRILDNRTNTLFDNDHWMSVKTQLKKTVPGSYAFMFSPFALAGEKLNMSAWHGYQQVFYKGSISPGNIELDFKLTKNSYLNICFYRQQDTLSAIRLSNHPTFPSAIFHAKDYRFFDKRPLQGVAIRKWNHLALRDSADVAIVYLNNNEIGRFNTEEFPVNTLGFGGSKNNVYIDNISFLDGESDKTIRESFDAVNSKYHELAMWLFIVAMLILGICFYKGKIYHISLVISVATAITVIFWGAYVLKLQYSYPKSWIMKWKGWDSSFGEEKTADEIIGDLIASGTTPGRDIILFIGTSQTWGAGAGDDDHTFVSKFCDLMNNDTSSSHFVCVNGGISGSTSTELYNFYETDWIKLNPGIVIINLSNNDPNYKVLRDNLNKFIALNQKSGITTYLILEVNDVDSRPITLNHEVMKELALENNLIAVDMHDSLKHHYDDGMLFWDGVHLTNYGYDLMAEILYRAISEDIRSNYINMIGYNH